MQVGDMEDVYLHRLFTSSEIRKLLMPETSNSYQVLCLADKRSHHGSVLSAIVVEKTQ